MENEIFLKNRRQKITMKNQLTKVDRNRIRNSGAVK